MEWFVGLSLCLAKSLLCYTAIPEQHKFTRTNAIINNSGNTKATFENLAFLFFCQQNYLPQWLRALTHMQLLIHVLFSFEWLKYQSLSNDFWSLGGSRSARLHLIAIYTIEFLNVC